MRLEAQPLFRGRQAPPRRARGSCSMSGLQAPASPGPERPPKLRPSLAPARSRTSLPVEVSVEAERWCRLPCLGASGQALRDGSAGGTPGPRTSVRRRRRLRRPRKSRERRCRMSLGGARMPLTIEAMAPSKRRADGRPGGPRASTDRLCAPHGGKPRHRTRVAGRAPPSGHVGAQGRVPWSSRRRPGAGGLCARVAAAGHRRRAPGRLAKSGGPWPGIRAPGRRLCAAGLRVLGRLVGAASDGAFHSRRGVPARVLGTGNAAACKVLQRSLRWAARAPYHRACPSPHLHDTCSLGPWPSLPTDCPED